MHTTIESNLLDQLKHEKNVAFEHLYRLYYPSIAAHIIRNSGTNEDAEDVFQEAIMVLLQQIRRPDFVLSSSLKTYLFSIARNLWLKRLRAIKQARTTAIEDLPEHPMALPFEGKEEPAREEKVKLWLTRITKNCQRILKAIFVYGEPIESLMNKMGWKNKHTAANQQYKCIQQVKKQKDKKWLNPLGD